MLVRTEAFRRKGAPAPPQSPTIIGTITAAAIAGPYDTTIAGSHTTTSDTDIMLALAYFWDLWNAAPQISSFTFDGSGGSALTNITNFYQGSNLCARTHATPGAKTATLSFTPTTNCGGRAVVGVNIANCTSVTQIGFGQPAAGTTSITANVTTTQDNSLLLMVVSKSNPTVSITPGVDVTEHLDLQSNAATESPRCWIGTKPAAVAGAQSISCSFTGTAYQSTYVVYELKGP